MSDELDEIGFNIDKHYTKKEQTRILEKRELYSNALKQKVKIISINPKNTFFYGSAILKNLAMVAGDYDIWEKFKKGETVEEVIKGIQKIIKTFISNENKFFIEFKSGICNDAVLYIGYLKDGKIINYDYNFINEQIDNKPYLKDLRKFVKKKPNIEEWMKLYDENRLIYLIRWTPEEIIRNKKELLNGEIITLEKTIIQPTITKIEVIFDINGRYIGMSNYYDIEKNETSDEEFKQSLQLNTLRMYQNEYWIKVVKRIFAQEKNFFKNSKIIENIFNFLIGSIGRLNRVNTDLKAIQEIIQIKKRVPTMQTIKRELDNIIDILAGIDINDLDSEKLEKLLNEAINNINNRKFIEAIDKIIIYISNIIKKHSLQFMKDNELYPLPNKYKPTSTKNIMNYDELF